MKAAAPQRAAYLAQQATGGGGGAAREPAWKKWAFGIGLGALIAGGFAVWHLVIQPRWDRWEYARQSGQPRGSAHGDGVVALFDSVEIERQRKDEHERNVIDYKLRVRTRDALTGAEVAVQLFDAGDGGCVRATPSRMWCNLGPLAVHDARTFARVQSVDDAVRSAGAGKPVAGKYAVDGATAYQLLDDGRVAAVDADTMAVRVSDKMPARLDGHVGTPVCLPIAAPGWKIAGDLRATVSKKGKPSETFLQPAILGVAPAGALVLHHASMEPAADHARISLVRDDGTSAWTVDLNGPCESWSLTGTNLVLVSTAMGDRAIGVDTGTGTVRWR